VLKIDGDLQPATRRGLHNRGRRPQQHGASHESE
jgi:hypothetical protein